MGNSQGVKFSQICLKVNHKFMCNCVKEHENSKNNPHEISTHTVHSNRQPSYLQEIASRLSFQKLMTTPVQYYISIVL